MPNNIPEHFQGKSVPEHLKEARMKGATASAELHGTEISGQKAAFADTLKDTAFAGSFFWLLLQPFLPEKQLLILLLLFLTVWTLWKTCRSASIGSARLERLHRLIEEERWEIEHHREQEKEELTELYQAKGFQGPLLTQVIDVLMADNNRLLQVMLDEELGLSLETYEHPLKQAFGALIAGLLLICLTSLSFFLPPTFFLLPLFSLLFLGAGLCTAKIERIALLPSFVWNLAIYVLCTGFLYFLQPLFK